MNTQEQLKKDIGDLLSLVRLQNLYTLHYFFADDVEDFYSNTKRYVAIIENRTQVDKRDFNKVISKMRATNKYCSISRYDIRNFFCHRIRMNLKYGSIIGNLTAKHKLEVFSHGSLHTKAMDKAEHYANRYFIPRFELENFLTNYDSVEDAFKDEKAKASKRVLARFDRLVKKEENPIELLDNAIALLEEASKMKLTQAQETAIKRRLELIDKFTTEIKGLFEGQTPEEVSTFSDAALEEMGNKRDALNSPKKVAAPKKVEVDFIDAMPKSESIEVKDKPKNKWIAALQDILEDGVNSHDLSPAFATKIAAIFNLDVSFPDLKYANGQNGHHNYKLQQNIEFSVYKGYREKSFREYETNRTELDRFLKMYEAKPH